MTRWLGVLCSSGISETQVFLGSAFPVIVCARARVLPAQFQPMRPLENDPPPKQCQQDTAELDPKPTGAWPPSSAPALAPLSWATTASPVHEQQTPACAPLGNPTAPRPRLPLSPARVLLKALNTCTPRVALLPTGIRGTLRKLSPLPQLLSSSLGVHLLLEVPRGRTGDATFAPA